MSIMENIVSTTGSGKIKLIRLKMELGSGFVDIEDCGQIIKK